MTDKPEVLIPADSVESLAISMKRHIQTCGVDHSATFKQIPLVDFVPALSSLTCRSCRDREYLKVPPAAGDTLDNYVCHLLSQQQEFFDKHFASCIAGKAIQ